ncbi:type IV secretion system protein (plasmid) [Moraxella bovis]|uniref:type IV secretion system protein n=1 Tax=Moraxella bovis TaxID=476 RepID=UPI0022267024|nr:type IV secretion system protein [Moraxella bovis]UZA49986.1 type IV secretion system protein [Moraxella bovis]
MKVTFSSNAKKAIFSIALLTTMGVANVAHSAIPVIDPAAIAQAVTQVKNQISQIENMRQQLKAITDNGNYANLLNDPNLRKQLNKYLPSGYTDIVQAVQKGDAGALQSAYNQVQQAEAQKRSSMTGEERLKVAQATQEAQMIVMMKHLDTRSSSVQNLVNQINRTQNTAQKQDLLNALQAEQSMIQIDVGRMQIMLQLSEQQRRSAERQAVDEYRKSTNR